MNDEKDLKRFREVRSTLQKCKTFQEKQDKLLELRFEFHDDLEGAEDAETSEEQIALPTNLRQEHVLHYFHSHAEPTPELLQLFLEEKNSKSPNYPLIRRYFKQGNRQLKRLIRLGLENQPTNVSWLQDLSFFNAFYSDVGELIKYYLQACIEAEDDLFIEILAEFECTASEYEYEVFPALLQHQDISDSKKHLIQDICNLSPSMENEHDNKL